MDAPISGLNPDRLDSWKEIAKYLGRDLRTVRRWEHERSLPVHRVPGGGHAAVYAFRSEIDEWLGERSPDHRQPGQPAQENLPRAAAQPDSKIETRWAGRWSRGVAVAVLVAAAASAAAWVLATRSHRQRPQLITVDFYGGQGKPLGFHLDGLRFGTPTFHPPATRNVPYFSIIDITCFGQSPGHCESGFEGDDYKLNYASWSDTQVAIDDYPAGIPGDSVVIALWKPDSRDPQDAVVWGGNIPPVKPGAPRISEVDFTGNGKSLHITVKGTRFGHAPPGVPGKGDLAFLQLSDFAYHGSPTKLSCYLRAGYSANGVIDCVTLVYSSWTDSRIEIDGFGGEYGNHGLEVRSGDPVAIELWSTETHLATAWGGRVP
jgi:excisionase family DNA binding protein